MIARAAFSKPPGAAGARRILVRVFFGLLLGLILIEPAEAQVTGSIGIDSDYRLRGNSLSDGRPTLSAEANYDDPSGAYFSLSGLTELTRNRRFLGVIGNLGYAKRVSERVTLDIGLLRSQIRAAVPDAPGFKYTEVYAGAYVGPITGRIYYSPDYRRGGQSTIYGELEAGIEPLPNWRLMGHVGLLTALNGSIYSQSGDSHSDWRISIARQLGKFELHAAVSRGSSDIYYGYRIRRKAALTVGGSMSF